MHAEFAEHLNTAFYDLIQETAPYRNHLFMSKIWN